MIQHAASCPVCNFEVKVSHQVSGKRKGGPVATDVTVCPECTSFLIYQQDLTLELMTMEEISALPAKHLNAMIGLREIAKMAKEYRATEV